MGKLSLKFYQNSDTLFIARQLIGKKLVTNVDGKLTSGIISETEAYLGITDKASHAFGDRRTDRTEVMYAAGGISYVYLCYGIHNLFNVVTGKAEVPHAVLIRNIIPLEGIDTMKERRNQIKRPLSSGPGTLTKALGINLNHNGIPLCGKMIWIEDLQCPLDDKDILITTRIGVNYAGIDAELPYRFLLKDRIFRTSKKN